MSRLQRCFQCGDPVLGLAGQDLTLPPYYLRPQPSPPDQEILDAQAYGDVHIQCFVGSRWGPVWAERVRDNLELVARFPVVWDAEGLVLLRHEVLSTRRTAAIRDDGWYAYLDDEALRARRPIPGGALLARSPEDYNIDVTGYPGVADVVRALRQGRSHPLLGLVDGLGLRGRLWNEAALETGRLDPSPNSEDDDDGEVWIEAVISYEMFVPDDVLDPVLAVLPVG